MDAIYSKHRNHLLTLVEVRTHNFSLSTPTTSTFVHTQILCLQVWVLRTIDHQLMARPPRPCSVRSVMKFHCGCTLLGPAVNNNKELSEFCQICRNITHNSGIIIFLICYATINPLKSQRTARMMRWSCYRLVGESAGNLVGRIMRVGENGQHT